jgi:hypothetical protein
MNSNRGIDYGMGQTNIDRSTGIRFGVINQNAVLQAWADSSEPDYGAPHCPHCGNECEGNHDKLADGTEAPDREDYDCDGCGDFACDDCKRRFDGEDAFGDSPNGWILDDGEYQCTCGEDGDIFILKSPYFTRAQFCSPCAPGACYLENPTDEGERAYCFGPDWFDESIEACPYSVWRVDTGELIYSPPAPSAD